jgi:hypothetical protein
MPIIKRCDRWVSPACYTSSLVGPLPTVRAVRPVGNQSGVPSVDPLNLRGVEMMQITGRHKIALRTALVGCMFLPTLSAVAQSDRHISVFAGATGVPMSPRLGHMMAGPSLGAALSTSPLRKWGALAAAQIIVPAGGASSSADCIANAPPNSCREHRTPNLLVGQSASLFLNDANRRVRVLAGVGNMNTWGMRGSDATQSLALQGEVQVRVFPQRRVTPMFSLAAMRLARSLGERRNFLLPGVGVAF